MKRFISVLLACAMCALFSTSVFAGEKPSQASSQAPSQEVAEEVTTIGTEASERALGTLLATNGGTIYNGMGSIKVTLPSGNFSAKFVAVLGYCASDVLVTVQVTDPSGNVYDLGSVSGNGNSTRTYTALYAQSGTYTFTFFSGKSDSMDVACYIYD